MVTLTNPLGLLALLGIPAVLAIHFLQRKATVIPVSTLFLLEKTQRESASGRRFERLVSSVPLWMQLLAVLLLTWLLCEPRYQSPQGVQRVAIVVDASASMQPFRDKLLSSLREHASSFQGPAANLELTVIEASASTPRLYSGTSLENALTTLASWIPRGGASDPTPALRLARSVVSRDGLVVYATDTPAGPLPYDARLLSIGSTLENTGFTGASFTEKEGAKVWEAIVRNYGKNRSTRQWWVELPGGRRTEPKSLTLEPGAMTSLQAAVPSGAERFQIVLEPDSFSLDDRLPLVVPQPKPLTLFAPEDPTLKQLADRFVHALDGLTTVPAPQAADVSLALYDALDPNIPDGAAIVIVRDDLQTGKILSGGVAVENHPLMQGLNWQSLSYRESIPLSVKPTDQILLQQQGKPLIVLRELPPSASRPLSWQLIFNFDLRHTQELDKTAVPVLFYRFFEKLRQAKIAPRQENLEPGQSIVLATRTGNDAPPLTIDLLDLDGKSTSSLARPLDSLTPLTAPPEPGFLRIHQGEQVLLHAGIQFADSREADFSVCQQADTLAGATAARVDAVTEEDRGWRIWLLLLLTALLISWHYVRGRRPESQTEAAAP